MEKDAEKAGFYRLLGVTKHLSSSDRLYRSSAPHYDGNNDSSQKLTTESLAFLLKYKINHVISANHQAMDATITKALANKNIAYTPLPVEDFGVSTLEQFEQAWLKYKKYRSGTLVWCGYGHGRTGTMVSALQIYALKEAGAIKGLSESDYTSNEVETVQQKKRLDELQTKLGLKKA